jgi:hypothetical protein
MESVPRDGWDEWYIFGEARDLGTSHLGENIFEVPRGPGPVSVFVNHCYTFHRPEHQAFAPLLWEQMDWIRPESYVADNEYLNKVHQAVKALP